MAGRPKKQTTEVKKVAPVRYDPHSDKPPKCYGFYVGTNRICHACWYAQECKKK